MDAILKYLGDKTKIFKNKEDLNLMKQLMKPPKKPKKKNRGHIPILQPNVNAQADLLFLPEDQEYKYILSYVDEARIADAVPLKTKQTPEVLKAFKRIYSRTDKQRRRLGIRTKLRPPSLLKVDDGGEFKGIVKKFFENKKTYVRVGRVGRKKQQALAEYLNFLLGKTIFTYENIQELRTGKTNTEWIHLLPDIIKAYNLSNKNKKPKNIDSSKPPKCSGTGCDLLDVGDKVRIPLEYPQDIATKKKLHGKFRAGDLRYDPKIRTITRVLMRPGSIVLYKVSGVNDTVYNKQELQKVK